MFENYHFYNREKLQNIKWVRYGNVTHTKS